MKGWIQFDAVKDLGSHHQAESGSGYQVGGGGGPYSKGPLRRSVDGDSYYMISYVRNEQEHPFTLLFHFFIVYKEALAPLGVKEAFAQIAVSILDEADVSKHGYLSLAHQLTPDEVQLTEKTPSNSSQLELQTPLGSLTGTIDSIRLRAEPHKSHSGSSGTYDAKEWQIDLTLQGRGLPLPYLAAGIIPFAGDIDYEYALPNMDTSGTLTFGNHNYHVTGTSWFDREWGYFGPCKWTWMAIELSNKARIALWDQQEAEHPQTFAAGESAFATIAEPGGSIAVASIEIEERNTFKSSRGGVTYPSSWLIRIPAKDIELKVQLRLPNDQEIITSEELASGHILTPRVEAKGVVDAGTYGGHQVTGTAFVELFNLFPAFTAFKAAQSATAGR